MKFKIDLEYDSDNSVHYMDSIEVATCANEDWVQIVMQSPARTIRFKKSEMRYALAFCGSVEDRE